MGLLLSGKLILDLAALEVQNKGNSMSSPMAYAFRYKAEVGDIVWAVTCDIETNELHVDKVTIQEIQDNSYHALKDDNGFTGEVIQSEDFENYSIGYWIVEEDISVGIAMYFGETLFLTEQEACVEACNIEKEQEKEELT